MVLHRRIEKEDDFLMIDGKWVTFKRETVWEVSAAGQEATVTSDKISDVRVEQEPCKMVATEDAALIEKVRARLLPPIKPGAFV